MPAFKGEVDPGLVRRTPETAQIVKKGKQYFVSTQDGELVELERNRVGGGWGYWYDRGRHWKQVATTIRGAVPMEEYQKNAQGDEGPELWLEEEDELSARRRYFGISRLPDKD